MVNKKNNVLSLIGKILLLVLIMAFIALPLVFINSIFGYFTILLFVIALLASFAVMQAAGRCIEITGNSKDEFCRRGEKLELSLGIKNRSFLVLPEVTIKLVIPDIAGNDDSVTYMPCVLNSKSDVSFDIKLLMKHVGVYVIGIESIEISDFFGIFKKVIHVGGQCSAVVTPRTFVMDNPPMVEEVLQESQMETKVAVVGGTDYTGVREYAPGDPMKQIHWKLSAHSRDYLTKIQESNRQQEFEVVLDFAAEKQVDNEAVMAVNDSLVETAFSVLKVINDENNDAESSILYLSRTGMIRKKRVTDDSQTIEMVKDFAIINTEPGAEFPDAVQLIKADEKFSNRSSNIIIITSRVTEALITELKNIKLQRLCPELYVIIPPLWNEKDLQGLSNSLSTLNSMNIPYHWIRSGERGDV